MQLAISARCASITATLAMPAGAAIGVLLYRNTERVSVRYVLRGGCGQTRHADNAAVGIQSDATGAKPNK